VSTTLDVGLGNLAQYGAGELICVGAFGLLLGSAIWIVAVSIFAARKKPPRRPA
jgi:hypothetical protein